MKDYDVVVVLWEDHVAVSRSLFPTNPDEPVPPTLSVGLIMKETDKVIVLVHDIERYDERDDVSYIIIYKSTILNIKKYGTIKIRKPRR